MRVRACCEEEERERERERERCAYTRMRTHIRTHISIQARTCLNMGESLTNSTARPFPSASDIRESEEKIDGGLFISAVTHVRRTLRSSSRPVKSTQSRYSVRWRGLLTSLQVSHFCIIGTFFALAGAHIIREKRNTERSVA
jgi:hypothetical protein